MTSRLRDLKGLRFIQHLLRHPGREFHVLELVSLVDHPAPAVAPSDVESVRASDAGELLDAQAREAYRRRITDLREDLAEAESWNDAERASRARDELDALIAELAAAAGLGGRGRKAKSDAERARLAVTKAIKAATKRIADQNAALGDHLAVTVRTGTFCSYAPDPRVPIRWSPTTEAEPGRREMAPAAVVASAASPFVGRRAELELVRGLLEEAVGGRGAVFLLVGGEPGVGKTRLATEAGVAAGQAGFAVHLGRCTEGETAPYRAVVEVLESIRRFGGDDTFFELLGAEAGDVARIMPSLRRAHPGLPAPLDLPPAQERAYVLDCVTSVVARSAALEPLFCVLDDLHWADDATLDWVRHASAALTTSPVALMVTYRDAPFEWSPGFAAALEALVRSGCATRVDLQPLEHEEVAELVRALTGHDAPSADISAIHQETAGNPFFVRELVHHLEEEGSLRAGIGEPAAIPDNVRIVVGRRVARLGDPAGDVLAAAAVLGMSFDYDVLAGCVDVDADSLIRAVEAAERAHLLVHGDRDEAITYAFTHALVRRTILDAVSAPRLRALHARAADALEAAGGEVAEIAAHLAAAGGLVEASRAHRWALRAADAAIGAAAFADALRHAERAMDLVPPDDDRSRAETLERVGSAMRSLGRIDACAQAWEEAIRLYTRLGVGEQAARLCRELGWQLGLTANLNRMVEVIRNGLAILGPEDRPERVRLLSTAGMGLSIDGRFEEADQALGEAAAAAERLGDDRLRADAAIAAAINGFATMEFGRSAERAQYAAGLLTGTPQVWDYAQSLDSLQNASLWLGEFERAAEISGEVRPLAERIGQTGTIFWDEVTKAVVSLAVAGDLRVFAEHVTRALELTLSGGMRWAADGHSLVGLARFWSGHWEEARRDFAAGTEREVGGAYVGRNRSFLLLHAAYSGHDDVVRLVDEMRPHLPTQDARAGLGPWTFSLAAVEALFVSGHLDGAAELGQLVDAAAGRTRFRFLDVRSLWTLRGLAAGAAGDLEAADECLSNAVADADSRPHALERADSRRLWAQLLRLRGGRAVADRAAVLAGEAAAIYREIGMPRHADLASGLS